MRGECARRTSSSRRAPSSSRIGFWNGCKERWSSTQDSEWGIGSKTRCPRRVVRSITPRSTRNNKTAARSARGDSDQNSDRARSFSRCRPAYRAASSKRARRCSSLRCKAKWASRPVQSRAILFTNDADTDGLFLSGRLRGCRTGQDDTSKSATLIVSGSRGFCGAGRTARRETWASLCNPSITDSPKRIGRTSEGGRQVLPAGIRFFDRQSARIVHEEATWAEQARCPRPILL